MDDNLIVRLLMIVAIILIIIFISKFIKADKIKRKKYIIGIIVFICIWCIFFTVDFTRTKNQQSPIFCPFTFFSAINDGGSVMHYGLGYKVIEFNKLLPYEDRIDIKLGSANYYYICSWLPSYNTAWEEVKEEAIKYSYENYLKNKELKQSIY